MSSSVGRLALTVGGGAIGSMFGVPQLGALAGGLLGQALFSDQLPEVEGPRLDDLRAQNAAYGQPIRRVWGTVRMPGNVIWQSDVRETTHKEAVGGKGAPSQTYKTYTYAVDVAIAFAKGEISGVRKVWANTKLIYELSDSVSGQDLWQSVVRATGITIYNGSETQEADPTIQASEGVADTPAFRGLAYMVLENFQLADFGNVIPNFTFEMVDTGTLSTPQAVEQVAITGGPEWQNEVTRRRACATFLNNGILRVVDTQIVQPVAYLYDMNGNFVGEDTLTPLLAEGILTGSNTQSATSEPIGLLRGRSETEMFIPAVMSANWGTAIGVGNILLPITTNGDGGTVGITTADLTDPITAGRFLGSAILCADQRHALIFTAPTTAGSGTAVIDKWHLVLFDGAAVSLVDEGAFGAGSPLSPPFAWSNLAWGQNSIRGVFRCGMLESDLKNFWIYNGAATHAISLFQLNETTNEFENVYEDNPAINVGSAHLPTIWADSGVVIMLGDTGSAVYTRIPLITNSTADLKDVVDDLQSETRLAVSQINNAALTGTVVRGYQLDKLMSARAAIEQLQRAFFFDMVESDYAVKSVLRGQASILNVPEDDLAANEEGGATPDDLEDMRAHDLELPRHISLKYHNETLDYQPNVQYFSRIPTQSEERLIFETTLILSDDEAAQIVDKMVRMRWFERDSYKFILPFEYVYLDPTDVVTLTIEGRGTFVVRLISIRYDIPGLLICEAKPERSATWDSSNTGGSPINFVQATVEQVGPTNLKLLDIPILRNADDEYGFYVAAGGFVTGWQGCTLHKSSDGGASYVLSVTLLDESTIGLSTDALVDGVTELIDTVNTVNIKTINGATLTSATEAQVRNGEANIAVLSSGTGWEVFGYIDVTVEADGSFTLSNLLRGMLGSESLTAGHAISDEFILLSSALRRMVSVASELGVEKTYKGVTNGNEIQFAVAQNFTTNAVGLMPYAPVWRPARANSGSPIRDPAGTITVQFERRTRLKFEWHVAMLAPLDEAAEVYEVDVMNGSVVVRIITQTISGGGSRILGTGTGSKFLIYTNADQTTDFGSAQDPITMRVYQLSDDIGRGDFYSEITI